MTETVRHHSSFRVAATQPDHSDPGDYRWASFTEFGEAHAFPPSPDGRYPGRSACDGPRWTAAARYVGVGKCGSCIALLRDQLRAVNVALAAAGIRTDRLDAYERRPDLIDYDAPIGAGEDVEASRG